MPTPKEEYTDRLNAIAARYGKMEDATIRQIWRELDVLRKNINTQLQALGDDPSSVRLRGQQAAINAMIARFEVDANRLLQDSEGVAFEDGALSVFEPLQAIGVTDSLFAPSTAQLNTLLDFSSDLITGITGDIRKGVDFQIKQVALGQETPFQAMQNVTTLFGDGSVKQGIFVADGVSAKAEMDVRTELQRVFNLSEQSQQLVNAEIIPGLLKRWIATADKRTRESHLRIHAETRVKPIPIKEPFVLRDSQGSAELMFPLDPRADIRFTVNCRCRMATIVPDIGVIGSSLDGRIGAELKRRDEARALQRKAERR